jgi:hypothetical protein
MIQSCTVALLLKLAQCNQQLNVKLPIGHGVVYELSGRLFLQQGTLQGKCKGLSFT